MVHALGCCPLGNLDRKNDFAFNKTRWHDVKLTRVMWDDLIDYGVGCPLSFDLF